MDNLLITQAIQELRSGPKTAAELANTLKISQATFSRLFKTLEKSEKVRVFGAGKHSIYSLPRNIGNAGYDFPLFRIDEQGKVHELGELTAIESRGYLFKPLSGKPQSFPGIPYYLSDARPQGYLGRNFASRHSNLGFPSRVQDWSEDQVFAALATRGEHLPGNLILGKESFHRLQTESFPSPIALNQRGKIYEKYSTAAQSEFPPGSSAAGEQPKFPAYLADERHVLVKFSPPVQSFKGRRWADLLIAESIALKTLEKELGIAVAKSEIVSGENRIFLESTRFDRIGKTGRKGCISFHSFEMEWVGSPSNWATSAKSLLKKRLISKEDAESIQLLEAYGRWIANSDRHYGNLSFYFEVENPKAKLAPIYDMLPMFFAPQDTADGNTTRVWQAPISHPDIVRAWDRARAAAYLFWSEVESDARISPDFRTVATGALKEMKSVE